VAFVIFDCKLEALLARDALEPWIEFTLWRGFGSDILTLLTDGPGNRNDLSK
jgi:hypothetical protein